jgi:hypothetical protein
LICAAFCLFPLLLFGGTFYLFKRRIANLERKAQALDFSFDATGFKFDSTDDPTFREHLPAFDLFSQGSSRKVRNLMRGTREGVAVSVFDYRYKPPLGGSSRRVWAQTVVALEDPTLDLPAFSLRPRNFLDRLDVGTLEEVEPAGAPDFNRRYVLEGEAPDRLRALFDPAVRGHLETHTGMSVEGAGGWLIYYKLVNSKSAPQIEPFMEEALALMRLLRASRKAESE